MKESILARFLEKLVKWLDPKLEKYREPTPPPEPPALPPYEPGSLEDLVGVLQRTSLTILSERDRQLIAAAMNFQGQTVGDIMLSREYVTYIYEHDFLGPLMLDKLYQSGFSEFPVVSSTGRQVIGVIRTRELNSLSLQANDRASKYADPRVFYLRSDYSLEQAVCAFARTNAYLFIVVDAHGDMVGVLSLEMLLYAILGYWPRDDFEKDDNLVAVMKRKDIKGEKKE